MSPSATLEYQFDAAMIEVYRRARGEVGYTATRLLQLVHEMGGLAAAKFLINSPTVSEGYAKLWERGRLDLSVEPLVLDARWRPLFEPQELERARPHLRDYASKPEPRAPQHRG